MSHMTSGIHYIFSVTAFYNPPVNTHKYSNTWILLWPNIRMQFSQQIPALLAALWLSAVCSYLCYISHVTESHNNHILLLALPPHRYHDVLSNCCSGHALSETITTSQKVSYWISRWAKSSKITARMHPKALTARQQIESTWVDGKTRHCIEMCNHRVNHFTCRHITHLDGR